MIVAKNNLVGNLVGKINSDNGLNGNINSSKKLDANLNIPKEKVVTTDYEELRNLPYINDILIKGKQTSSDLKLQDEMEVLSNLEIEEIFRL